MNKKQIGNNFEKMALRILQEHGYWCHLFSYDANGQPCDIIAFDDADVFLIDVKHCKGDRFSTSRIEPNQYMCFKYANELSKKAHVGFAIYFDKILKFKWLPWNKDVAEKPSYHYNELYDFYN